MSGDTVVLSSYILSVILQALLILLASGKNAFRDKCFGCNTLNGQWGKKQKRYTVLLRVRFPVLVILGRRKRKRRRRLELCTHMKDQGASGDAVNGLIQESCRTETHRF